MTVIVRLPYVSHSLPPNRSCCWAHVVICANSLTISLSNSSRKPFFMTTIDLPSREFPDLTPEPPRLIAFIKKMAVHYHTNGSLTFGELESCPEKRIPVWLMSLFPKPTPVEAI